MTKCRTIEIGGKPYVEAWLCVVDGELTIVKPPAGEAHPRGFYRVRAPHEPPGLERTAGRTTDLDGTRPPLQGEGA